MRTAIIPGLIALLLSACVHRSPIDAIPRINDRPGVIETTSLLDKPLRRLRLDTETRDRLQANLDEAWDNWQANPNDEVATIWLGRRLAYLSRYNDAVAVFTEGLRRNPDSHKLLRHRGHRFITLRRFDDAITDLSRAAEFVETRSIPDQTEPDGAPNAQNIPLTTTNSNIYYHLALAHYLNGDYEQALEVHRRGEPFSGNNDDQRVSRAYWVYRALRELDRDGEARALLDAALQPGMNIIENHAYYELLRAYQARDLGRDPAESNDAIFGPTFAYGIAAEHAANGDTDHARELFQAIIEGNGSWAAFGSIAAEARLAR